MRCPACGLELGSRRMEENGKDMLELQCRNKQCQRFGLLQRYSIEELVKDAEKEG